jgi:hypothetical protein
VYAISESEQEAEGDDDDGYGDRFQNPEAFLSRFGGYESENSEDPNDEDEEENDPNKGKLLEFSAVANEKIHCLKVHPWVSNSAQTLITVCRYLPSRRGRRSRRRQR